MSRGRRILVSLFLHYPEGYESKWVKKTDEGQSTSYSPLSMQVEVSKEIWKILRLILAVRLRTAHVRINRLHSWSVDQRNAIIDNLSHLHSYWFDQPSEKVRCDHHVLEFQFFATCSQSSGSTLVRFSTIRCRISSRRWYSQYLKVRYSRTVSATHVNRSGNMANGPRPNG